MAGRGCRAGRGRRADSTGCRVGGVVGQGAAVRWEGK